MAMTDAKISKKSKFLPLKYKSYSINIIDIRLIIDNFLKLDLKKNSFNKLGKIKPIKKFGAIPYTNVTLSIPPV